MLPLVASISVSPGLMSPRFSASTIIDKRGPILDRAGRIVALELGEHHVARLADEVAEVAPAAYCRRYLRWFCTWEA